MEGSWGRGRTARLPWIEEAACGQISTDSDLPADTVLAAITDFSSRRPTLWPNIDPGIYKVHEVGADWADVTEGSKFAGGVWARERYEWSVPGVVRATVQDSNIFKSGVDLHHPPGADPARPVPWRRLDQGARHRRVGR